MLVTSHTGGLKNILRFDAPFFDGGGRLPPGGGDASDWIIVDDPGGMGQVREITEDEVAKLVSGNEPDTKHAVGKGEDAGHTQGSGLALVPGNEKALGNQAALLMFLLALLQPCGRERSPGRSSYRPLLPSLPRCLGLRSVFCPFLSDGLTDLSNVGWTGNCLSLYSRRKHFFS